MTTEKQNEQPVTIVFRGLMCLHYDRVNQVYEAGILPALRHVFRINAITLEEEPDFGLEGQVLSRFDSCHEYAGQIWRLESTSAKARGVSQWLSNSFDRLNPNTDPRDFRWNVDLEGSEFYDRELHLTPGVLMPTLQITSGRLYTRRLTDVPMERKKGNGQFVSFGKIVVDTAVEIEGGAVLRNIQTGEEIFRFESKPNIIYRIQNTPELTDRDAREWPVLSDHALGSAAPDYSNDPCGGGDDFRYYYQAFPVADSEKFEFRLQQLPDARVDLCLPGLPPSPSPRRCGCIYLGKRVAPFE